MIKPGASIRGLQPPMYLAWQVFCEVLAEISPGVNPVLTEGTGGKHKIHSLHYVGLAIDLRSNTIPGPDVKGVVEMLRRALSIEYNVILEDNDTPNEHIHVEYQP